MKMTEGLATSSTAMVRRLRCSTERPLTPGMPTSVCRSGVSSTMSSTSLTYSRTCAAKATQVSGYHEVHSSLHHFQLLPLPTQAVEESQDIMNVMELELLHNIRTSFTISRTRAGSANATSQQRTPQQTFGIAIRMLHA